MSVVNNSRHYLNSLLGTMEPFKIELKNKNKKTKNKEKSGFKKKIAMTI